MKISAASMEAALGDFQDLNFPTAFCSLFESYLVSKWLEADGRYEKPGAIQIEDVNAAVTSLFELLPGHDKGRLYPFRYDWKNPAASGRKTVWNTTTRSYQNLARTIFQVGGPNDRSDIRNGLLSDAARRLHDAITKYNSLGSSRHFLRLPKRQALVCLIFHNHSFPADSTWESAESMLLNTLSMTRVELELITRPDELGTQLVDQHGWNADTLPGQLAPRSSGNLVRITQPLATTAAYDASPIVTVDRRVERMLRHAVINYPFVLLVGPPGTGKGRLIHWITNEVANDPKAFGFSDGMTPNPIWATPDESWSSFELLGGLVPDQTGKLLRSPGLVVNAVETQRWLVLDEINRADMDKIMGPLLTWLAGQEVEIGRTGPGSETAINLGWSGDEYSRRDDSDKDRGVSRILAGRSWRLLGTYNPQDALRVFRFGLALSRRFVVIPVPIPTVGQFEELLQATYPSLSDDTMNTIVSLYSGHRSSSDTALGPAVFLRMANYYISVESSDLEEVVAEVYVMSVGKYLSSYDDDTMEQLRTRMIEDEGVIGQEQWAWIRAQRDNLS